MPKNITFFHPCDEQNMVNILVTCHFSTLAKEKRESKICVFFAFPETKPSKVQVKNSSDIEEDMLTTSTLKKKPGEKIRNVTF